MTLAGFILGFLAGIGAVVVALCLIVTFIIWSDT